MRTTRTGITRRSALAGLFAGIALVGAAVPASAGEILVSGFFSDGGAMTATLIKLADAALPVKARLVRTSRGAQPRSK